MASEARGNSRQKQPKYKDLNLAKRKENVALHVFGDIL